MELVLTLQDWIAVTTSLMAALSPAYLLIWQMKRHIAKLTMFIEHCPYCKKGDRNKMEIIEQEEL